MITSKYYIFILSLILLILNSIFPLEIYTVLLFLLLTVYLGIIYATNTRYLFINAFLLFYLLFNCISIFFIDLIPIYLRELSITTYFNGSSAFFISIAIIIIFITDVIYSKFIKHKEIYLSPSIGKFLFIVNTLNFLAIFIFIWDKPEFMTSLGRQLYRSTYLTSNMLIYILQGLYNLSGIFVGVIFLYKKKYALMSMVLLVVYGLWIGEKFGFYFRNMSFFVMFIGFSSSNFELKKIVKVLFIISSVMIIVFFVERILLSDYSFLQTLSYTGQRLAQQNQLTWFFYNYSYTGDSFWNEFRYFFVSLNDLYSLNFTEITSFGQFKLISLASTNSFLLYKIRIQSRLATGVFAQFLIYFDTAIPLITYLITLYAIFVFIIRRIYKNFTRAKSIFDIIVILLLFRFIVGIVLSGMFQSITDFINISTVYDLFIIIILSLINKITKSIKIS